MNFLRKHWHNIVGGVIFSAISLIISLHFPWPVIVQAVVTIVGIVCGLLIAENIQNLLYFRRCRILAKMDKKLLDEAAPKGKRIYLLEKEVLKYYHQKFVHEFHDLFQSGTNMSIIDYEKLLEIFIRTIENLDLPEIQLKTSCLILPSNFDIESDYANMWFRVCEDYLNKTKAKLVRILCNHKKDNLVEAILNFPEKFKDFCSWNKRTGFHLFFYKGNYDNWRRNASLPINDFGILNDIVLIGGEVSEEEKLFKSNPDKLERKDSSRVIEKETMSISRIQLSYDVERYNDFLDRILHDNRCMEVDLHSKKLDQICDECINFCK